MVGIGSGHPVASTLLQNNAPVRQPQSKEEAHGAEQRHRTSVPVVSSNEPASVVTSPSFLHAVTQRALEMLGLDPNLVSPTSDARLAANGHREAPESSEEDIPPQDSRAHLVDGYAAGGPPRPADGRPDLPPAHMLRGLLLRGRPAGAPPMVKRGPVFVLSSQGQASNAAGQDSASGKGTARIPGLRHFTPSQAS